MSKIIRDKRKEKKMTEQDLADILGVTRATVSRYENGRRKPRGPIAKALSKELDIPLEEII